MPIHWWVSTEYVLHPKPHSPAVHNKYIVLEKVPWFFVNCSFSQIKERCGC
jgi:hypothetical protein